MISLRLLVVAFLLLPHPAFSGTLPTLLEKCPEAGSDDFRAGELTRRGVPADVLLRYLAKMQGEQCQVENLARVVKNGGFCESGEARSSCFLRLADERHRQRPLTILGASLVEVIHDEMAMAEAPELPNSYPIVERRKNQGAQREKLGEAVIYGQRWLCSRAKPSAHLGESVPLIDGAEISWMAERKRGLLADATTYLLEPLQDGTPWPGKVRQTQVQKAFDGLACAY